MNNKWTQAFYRFNCFGPRTKQINLDQEFRIEYIGNHEGFHMGLPKIPFTIPSSTTRSWSLGSRLWTIRPILDHYIWTLNLQGQTWYNCSLINSDQFFFFFLTNSFYFRVNFNYRFHVCNYYYIFIQFKNIMVIV